MGFKARGLDDITKDVNIAKEKRPKDWVLGNSNTRIWGEEKDSGEEKIAKEGETPEIFVNVGPSQ